MEPLKQKFGAQGNYLIVPENDYNKIVPLSVQDIFKYLIDEVWHIPTWHERYVYDNSAKEARQVTIQGNPYRIVEIARLSLLKGQESAVKLLAPDIDNIPDYCLLVNKDDLQYALNYYGG